MTSVIWQWKRGWNLYRKKYI